MMFIRRGACGILELKAPVVLFCWLYYSQFAFRASESKNTPPVPIVVPPSQTWDGNDGPWSTLALQIGTPPQTVKVFASTASYETWAIAPEGCQAGDPTDCRKLRGELFNSNSSSTWQSNLSNKSNNVYPLDLESALGYQGRGRYGFDDITLGYIGSNGPTLKNQTIAGIAAKGFFMGLFGLNPRSSNFTSFNNPIPSFMQNLRNQSMIPSLSWAYTAGNTYRFTKVFGSLVLGGYDSARFIPNNLTFPFSVNTGLETGLASVKTGEGVSLLPSPLISISLDSTIPYIYLPEEACTLFENAFGLTWNDTTQLYLLNDTQHSVLKTQNPSITFTLGVPPTTIEITLPYSAFDLTASWPLVADPTPYFPLKRALNETQYLLGRTFFQEAYVIADYEIGTFSVSQCKWDPALTENIVAIVPPSNGTNSSPKSATLPTGAIAGIGIGGAAVLLVGALLLYLCYLKPRRRKKLAELDGKPISNTTSKPAEFMKAELESTPFFSRPMHEAGSKTIIPPVEMSDTGVHHLHELPAQEGGRSEFWGMDEQRSVGRRS